MPRKTSATERLTPLAQGAASSTIDQIVARVQAAPLANDGSLTLTPDLFSIDAVTAFFANVLKVTSFTVAGAQRQPMATPKGINVVGQADVLGYTGLTVTLSFTSDNDAGDQVLIGIDGTFAPTKTVTLPVVTWISVAQLGLAATYESSTGIVQFSFRGMIQAGSGAQMALIPFSLSADSGTGWKLSVAEGTATGVTADQLVTLLGGNALESFLPPVLTKILTGITVTGIDTIFDPAAGAISYFATGITVTNGWDIAPKVSLDKGLHLSLTLVRPTDAVSKQLIGMITGTFLLDGTTVPLFIQAEKDGTGDTVWTFGVQPDQTVTLPSFSSLFGLAGGQDFLNTLPPALSQIPAIEIDELRIVFDPAAKTLNEIAFTIQTASSWPVVANYFTVENIYAALDITDVTDSTKRTVAGDLRATFDVSTDIPLQCEIKKEATDPHWTLTAGLAPGKTVDLVRVAQKLLGEITLPGTQPTMTFSVLQISVTTGTGVFTFSAHSADTWNFINSKSFAIESFDLDFTRDPAKTPALSGTLKTTLLIGSVDLSLTAALGASKEGGWFFEGKTGAGQKIEIGEVIAYFADKFGIKDIPDCIKGISLSDLDVSFDTGSKNFTFAVTGEIPLATKTVDIFVKISALKQTDGSFTKDLQGTITIGGAVFTLELMLAGTGTRFQATWKETDGGSLGFASIADAMGLPAPTIPDGLDLGLIGATFLYETDAKGQSVVFTAQSKNYGQAKAVFAAYKPATTWIAFFGLSTGKTIDLTNLPLVGAELAKIATVSLANIVAEAATGSLTADNTKYLKGLYDSSFPQPPDTVNAGVSLSMTFTAGSYTAPLRFATGSSSSVQSTTQAVALSAAPAAGADDGTKWFTLQKTFGPVAIQKIGVRYKDSQLWALMNASLSVGGLTISTIALGMGSKLTAFTPHFTVSGIDVTFAEGPIVASGGLVGTIDPVDFYGEMMLKVPELQLGALGGFAMVDSHPSFFLYLTLDMPIGGPPYFFVTGLALGLGFNRKLVIPDVSGVSTFPFVQWAMGNAAPSSIAGSNIGEQITNTLTTLAQSGVVAPQIGEYWVAAGIRFTSFELVDSFALLTVSFGNDFEVDILGLSRVVLPPAAPTPVALIELQLKASFAPSRGLISVEGQLTNASYVLSTAAHLTGGFAFYVWFAGEHEGEFVASVGGYSPHFDKPNYYPDVPRLGLRWQVSGALTVTGDEYFTVTSSAVMAGGGLSAVWDGGPISAWFDVQVDFLLVYIPFHYYLSASCQLGASFSIDLWFTTITITIHLGVGIEIWGPEFTGRATVDLSIVSFTISFGASGQQVQTTVDWPTFMDKLLPKPQKKSDTQQLRGARFARPRPLAAVAADDPATPPSVIHISILDGLIKTLSEDDNALNYIVDGKKCKLSVAASIPSKDWVFVNTNPDKTSTVEYAQISLAATGNDTTPNTQFGIGPTGTAIGAFTSTQTVQITSKDEPSVFHAVRTLKNVPTSLWQTKNFDGNGVPSGVDPLNGTTISNVLVGFELDPYVAPPDQTLDVDLEDLRYTIDDNLQHFVWSTPVVPATSSFPGATVPTTIATGLATTNRPALLAAILRAGVTVDTSVDPGDLASAATYDLNDDPILALLGQAA